jgi:hypothetical protein
MTKAERRAEYGRRMAQLQPRYRRGRHAVCAGYIRQCFAGFAALQRFLTVERQQLAKSNYRPHTSNPR